MQVSETLSHLAPKPGETIFGRLFWWELGKNRVSRATLVSAASGNATPTKYLPEEIEKVTSFRRAVNAIRTRLPKESEIKKVFDGKTEILYLVQRAKSVGRGIQHTPLLEVTFSKVTHTHSVHRAPACPAGVEPPGSFALTFDSVYAYYRDHTKNDVRAIMTNYLRSFGVTVRSAGGVYYVPEDKYPVLESICKTVEQVGPNTTSVLAVADRQDNVQTISRDAQGGLERELTLVEQALAEFEFEGCRPSTLRNRMSDFDEMQSKVSLFAGVLNLRSAELTKRLNECRGLVRHYMAGGTPENAPRFEPKGQVETTEDTDDIPAFDIDLGF